MVEMTPLSISLAVVVVLLQLVKTETTGFVRIEIPKFNTPISSHAYEIKTERNIEKVDAKNKWFSEDFRICLATIVKGNGVQAEKKIWRLRSCGKFRGPDIQVLIFKDQLTLSLIPFNLMIFHRRIGSQENESKHCTYL